MDEGYCVLLWLRGAPAFFLLGWRQADGAPAGE